MQEVAIFRWTLQISNGIPMDNRKFPTKEIMSAQNGIFGPRILHFWTKIFWTRGFSDNFSVSHQLPSSPTTTTLHAT